MTEESECPRQKAPGSPGKMHTVSMDRLKLLSKDVEQRRTVLGKSWDELQMVLSQYHASLVVRQEQFDMQCEDSNSYIAKLENELEKRNTEHDHLRSKLTEYESKVHKLEKENSSLRSEQERLSTELKVKENLVTKIQGQMSKEGLEYCAEINALKESLGKLTAEAEGRRKRPRVEEVPVSKSDAPPRDSAPSAESPPTFSMATMPHLALPTTSSDVLDKQNDVPVTSQYDSMTSQPEIGHQVIQVPPLTQAKAKLVKKPVRLPRPRQRFTEMVHPSLLSAHTCKVCGRSFGARYDLQRHERIHSGEKPYFCSGCYRRFARKDHLRLHMVRVHGLEEGASLSQKESVEVLIQGEDKDPLTVLREQQLAYQSSLHDIKLESNDNNYPMFPENEAITYKASECEKR